MELLNSQEVQGCVEWLLANGSPPVQYLTRRDFLGTPTESKLMRDLWRGVEAEKDVQTLFAGQMGFDASDPRVARACDYAFTDHPPASEMDGCGLASFLSVMGAVGMADDSRVAPYYTRLLATQMDDGGWLAAGHLDGSHAPYKIWDRGCPMATHHGALALYWSGQQEHRAPLLRALQFLVWHLGTKDEKDLQTWFYRGHDMVKEMLILSELNVGLDQRPVQAVLEWLMAMYEPQHRCFTYRGKPISKYSRRTDGASPRVLRYRTYHLRESDWLTYYMARIAKSANENAEQDRSIRPPA